MKISKSIGDKFPYMHYQSETPNKNLVVVVHGLGEVGPADGSALSKVEQPNTYAKHASKGVEFPFNIIAPVAVKSHGRCLIRHIHSSRKSLVSHRWRVSGERA